MASWKESMSRMAQNAVMKSKEMAEITRLNVEISNTEQKVREIYVQLGEYLTQHPELLPLQDETVQGFHKSLLEAQESLAAAKQALLDVKNINICPGCGAEVSRSSKFCDRCGTAIDHSILENANKECTCPQCGAPVEASSLFCGNCGAKLGE